MYEARWKKAGAAWWTGSGSTTAWKSGATTVTWSCAPKWTMDGATTLAEAAARFRERAKELHELARAGFELEQPVHDDHASIVRPGEESPMPLVEEDE